MNRTRPAPADVVVRGPLAAPRVPAFEPLEAPTRPSLPASPVMRIMRAEACLHSSESSGLAAIAEAFASADANGKILMVELAKRIGGAS